jgi:predicted nucleic acid-binding protein
MYLVDTNVISEVRKGSKANPGVLAFWNTVESADLYIAVQSVGEIRRGLENVRQRGDNHQALRLETWLDLIVSSYGDRILSFDTDCAQVWGRMMSPHPQHPIDKQIAAIALMHGMTVVTRNVDDFRGLGVEIHNPFH